MTRITGTLPVYFCDNISPKPPVCTDEENTSGRSVHNGKGKVHPCTGSEALYRPCGPQGELRYCSTLSPGNTQYPFYRRLGGPQARSGQAPKISSPPGFDPWTVQSVASRCTNWATRPTGSVHRLLWRKTREGLVVSSKDIALEVKGKGKVIPLQAQCGPEGG